MRVVQVLLSPSIGGAETLAASLETAWRSTGHAATTVFVDPSVARRGRLRRTLDLRAAMRGLRPDVIVAHSALPSVYARMVSGKVPVVSVLHSASDDFSLRSLRYAERALQRRTAAVVAVARWQASSYVDRFGSRTPVRVIPNGIDPSFEPSPQPVEEPLLVEVARVADQKNPLLWLRGIARVRESWPNVSAEWWGPLPSGTTSRQLVRTAEALGLSNVFRGATADAVGVLRRASVFVHAAGREAHSIGILEAAAAGVPIVCSETVRLGLPAWLEVHTFIDGDASSLGQTVTNVLRNEGEYRIIARLQSPRVAAEYSMTQCAAQYMDLMREIAR